MILACQKINKSYGDNRILRDVSFHMEAGEKLAIVGINGSGKTTLLRLIVGEEPADDGQIVIAKDTTIGYLSQHQEAQFDNTIYGEMRDAKQYLIDMEREIRALELEMKHADEESLPGIMENYNRLSATYDRENGYAVESEITGVLSGLGFTKDDYTREIKSLSGGERMRVALGRLLLTHPDIIILDEPTNHLDVTSVAWLEGYLSSYQGSVIIVSHDRYFIDKVADRILEIDQGEASLYPGNYHEFYAQRAAKREARMRAYLNQQAEIKHQQDVIDKLKSFNREKSIKRAESREKMLSKIEVLERPTEAASEMRITLEPSVESGQDVLTISGLSKSFGGRTLFSDLSMEVKRGERVAIIGANGTGKTTILKMINRLVARDAGSIETGSRVKIGYYDQEHQVLSMDKSIFDEIRDAYPDLTNTKIRQVLAAFLFTGDDVFKRIGDLSGGEKGRVSLAKLMLSPANFLILDEPTNHLDITSKEILEDALSGYTGTVLFVSHDRYFINRVATRILELKDASFFNFIGNYDYYISHRDDVYAAGGARTESAIKKPAASTASKDAYLKNKEEAARIRKRENDLKRTEAEIAETEAAIEKIDAEIALPEHATNAAKLGELASAREALDEKLIALYEHFYELEES